MFSHFLYPPEEQCIIFLLQLSRSQDTVVLCIVFLQTISEELACPREELSYSRRSELRRLLSQQVPTMLTLLTGQSSPCLGC